jgi:hypothetical protein
LAQRLWALAPARRSRLPEKDLVVLAAVPTRDPPVVRVAALAVRPQATPVDPLRLALPAAPAATVAVRLLVTTDLADPADRVDPAGLAVPPMDLVGPAAPVTTALVGLVGPAITVLVGLAVLATTVLVDPAVLATTVPVGPAVLVDPAAPATRGAGTRSAATSTARRGARAPHRGVGAHRRGRTGAARCLVLVACGVVARSTTTATTRRRCGIPDSTLGASGSSGCGSRCKEPLPTTPALADSAERAPCCPGVVAGRVPRARASLCPGQRCGTPSGSDNRATISSTDSPRRA